MQMQKRLLLCQKEKEGVEDELQALKEVKRVLQRELNIIQKEKETMFVLLDKNYNINFMNAFVQM